jgi:putative DNA methylase
MRRKLIEVALPLEAINVASAHEKNIRHAHPSTLHLWWARRPLATCRAVIFASLVDDPSSDPERFPTQKAQEEERIRLFRIIEELVLWENSTNEEVLERARAEIRRSTGGKPPPLFDPFCGGGSIPLEAQRLGLATYASDLNPVAVLITAALIEIPAKFAGQAPVHPEARRALGVSGSWPVAAGLAEDIRRYGAWMRDEAERRIGGLYPKVRLPKEQGGGEATVVAWLWARTVKCPNPACGARMPLVRSFTLSARPGREAWVEPIVDRIAKTVHFDVRAGRGSPREGTVAREGAHCTVCDSPVALAYIRDEGRAGRMDSQLMAIVADGPQGRIYLGADSKHEAVARSAQPEWGPEEELQGKLRVNAYLYGLIRFRDLFTKRQLVALTTFSDLVGEARERVLRDAIAANLHDDVAPLTAGGAGAIAYADAVATYLAFAVDKMTDTNTTLCTWQMDPPRLRATFGRQALPMTWDYAEACIFADAAGDFQRCVGSLTEVLDRQVTGPVGQTARRDATDVPIASKVVVSTDPPYYDNIGYADLSDFFYVWLRRSLGAIHPSLFETMLTPKESELVATPYRFGGSRAKAEQHFESGLRKAFERIRAVAHEDFPITIYYAFKQTEVDVSGETAGELASTGWETMLAALIQSGLAIDGTWPMRSELATRNVGRNANALASSIVLVCRPLAADAGITTRKNFVAQLKQDLPEALRTLQHGNIAPVDLAQASIGPGMAIFSRFARVLEPDGSAMRIRTALALINQALGEILSEQEGEFDADTRWAIAWYEQFGLNEADSGRAILLTQAKNTSLDGLKAAGIIDAHRGKTRLLNRTEYTPNWDPSKDARIPVWEVTQRLVNALLTENEAAAGDLLARLGGLGDTARDLAYRLYQLAEQKGWTDEARAYNALVVAWPDLVRHAEQERRGQPAQASLGLET